MKKTEYLPSLSWMLKIVFIFAVTLLCATGISQAQSPNQGEDNGPGPGVKLNQAAPPINLPDDNVLGAHTLAAPDLIITDPDADVMAQVAEFTALAPAISQAIPAAAFTVDGSGRQWFFPFNGGYIYPSGGSYCGIAPVSLPDGAQVTSFLSYVLDNDAAQDAFVYLYAKPLGTTASSTTMAVVGTTGQNAALQALVDATITQPVINNSAYVYHVGVCLWGTTSTQQFYASQILYQR
jgi:hypothetical protein